jgi:hypothetical protein
MLRHIVYVPISKGNTEKNNGYVVFKSIVHGSSRKKGGVTGGRYSARPQPFLRTASEAGTSKTYCATSSGSPQVELRFCPWIILFIILNWAALPEAFSMSLWCVCIFRGARPNFSLRWQDLRSNTRTQKWLKIPLLDKKLRWRERFLLHLRYLLIFYIPRPPPFRPVHLCVKTEPVFVNVDSSNLHSLAGRYGKQGCRTGPPGWESISCAPEKVYKYGLCIIVYSVVSHVW